jgi:hypothetical protein
MLLLLPALLTVALTSVPDADALLSAPDRRVRSTDARINGLLEIGVERSPTFLNLLRALNATDVIVYLERTRDLPAALAGRMLMLPLAGQQRYLRIQIRSDLPSLEMISLIAHELRHALEIAENPAVRDQPGMLALYRRIGRATKGAEHTYDTSAAQSAGRQVRLELVG